MLLNILHTIAITTSIGASILTMQPKNREEQRPTNRANNQEITEYDINDSWELWAEFTTDVERQVEIDDYASYTTISSSRTYSDDIGALKIDIKQFRNTTQYTQTQPYAVNGKIVGIGDNNQQHLDNSVISQETGDTLPIITEQQLILFKIQSIGTNVDMNLSMDFTSWIGHNPNLKNLLYNDNLTNYTMNFLCRFLTSKNNNMNQYFTKQNVDIWNEWYNNRINKNLENAELNDAMNQIVYKVSGYNSSIKTQIVNGVNDGTYVGNFETPIGLYPNSTTYFALYVEPRVIKTNINYNIAILKSTGTPPFETQIIQDRNYIELTGKVAVNPNTQEVIDVPSVMFDVLGMPFTFISTAFNLTLFPNTPYELNISLLFLSIIAVIVFVFLIKFIIGRFS